MLTVAIPSSIVKYLGADADLLLTTRVARSASAAGGMVCECNVLSSDHEKLTVLSHVLDWLTEQYIHCVLKRESDGKKIEGSVMS